MKIYIQSKSGNYNEVLTWLTDEDLYGALKTLRKIGGYKSTYKDQDILVPFEEIEYIREATD